MINLKTIPIWIFAWPSATLKLFEDVCICLNHLGIICVQSFAEDKRKLKSLNSSRNSELCPSCNKWKLFGFYFATWNSKLSVCLLVW